MYTLFEGGPSSWEEVPETETRDTLGIRSYNSNCYYYRLHIIRK